MDSELDPPESADLRARLKSLGDELGEIFIDRAAKFKRASLFAKIGLISIGSAIAAIAQFAQFPPTGPTAWQIAGIGASIIVAVGGIFVWITEDDAPREISAARKALEKAREALVGFEEIYEILGENDRLVSLIQSISLMRSVIERGAGTGLRDDQMARLILEACDRTLTIAMGFQLTDQWTVGVYQTVNGAEGRRELKCIATKRAIPCDPSDARKWKEGTGIAGVSFSVRDEVMIPDLQSEGISSVFGAAANEVRNYDTERYRSMVAVPIMVGSDPDPWGVVAATSDRVSHFSASQGNGLSNAEGARTLANMVALGVAVCRIAMNKSDCGGFPTKESGDTENT